MPAGTLNVGTPLRVVLPVKFSAPPPATLKVLLKERPPPKFTAPALANKDEAVTLTALGYVAGEVAERAPPLSVIGPEPTAAGAADKVPA